MGLFTFWSGVVALRFAQAQVTTTCAPGLRCFAPDTAAVAADVNENFKKLAANSVPPGTIIMWGSNTIPPGWALCDGRTLTVDGGTVTLPDLRNRFVIGANNQNQFRVNQTGGSNQITLLPENIPEHRHTISNDGSHSHQYYARIVGDSAGPTRDNVPVILSSCLDCPAAQTYTTSVAGNHSHGGTTGPAGSLNPTPLTYIPPYYSLLFIQKL